MSSNGPHSETFELHALAQAGEGVFVTRGPRLVDADEGCTVISGYTRDELLAMPSVIELVAPRERALIADRLRRRLAGEMLEPHCESAIIHKDGREVPVEVAARLVSREEGRILVFVRDLSSRRQETDDYADLFMNAPVPYHEIDAEGRITRVNDTELALFGYTREELIGRPVWTLARDPDLVRTSVLRRIRSAEPPPPIERALLSKTGETVWVLVTSRHRRDEHGAVAGMRVILLDITDRKAADARRMQAHKLEAVSRLAGGIAHDFNNLLTIIMGYAQALTETLPEASVETADAREIVAAAERAADLTRRLLAFSGQQPMTIVPLGLGAAVDAALPLLERHAGTGVAVRARPTRSPCQVTADPVLLQQVLLDVVLNAREALPSGGEITITVTPDAPPPPGEPAAARFHRIEIADSGVGMPPDVRARALDPFFSTKEVGQGPGLGLPAAYGLVRQMGGHLSVRSEPGKGATVSIWLPVAGADRAHRRS